MSASEVFGLGERAIARRSDPETSHEAAASIHSISDLQAVILSCFEDRPMTDEAMFDAIVGTGDANWLTPSGYRSRRNELVAKGLLEWSGQYGETKAGRKARIWRVKA